MLHGDAGSEQFLSEMFNPAAYPDRGTSAWRASTNTARAWACGACCASSSAAACRSRCSASHGAAAPPEVTQAFVELGHEIACHGWRWIHYQTMDEAQEREHMRIGMEIIERLTGERPWAGTPAATAPTRAAWWPTTAASSTTATTTATTCRSGRR